MSAKVRKTDYAIVKVQNKTDKELADIGRKIGEAFAGENAGVVSEMPQTHVVKIFQIMTEFYYRLGRLYTLPGKEVGYIAYWPKSFRIPFNFKLRLVGQMLKQVPLSSCLKMAPTGSEQFAKAYKREDYIAVSMLVVLQEFQGQGFMRPLLAVPFSIAEEQNIPCVLDTDTELKVKKYEKCQMKVSRCRKMINGFPLYTMEYRIARTQKASLKTEKEETTNDSSTL